MNKDTTKSPKDRRNEAEAELKRIADENEGRVTPQDVVETARDPGNPMHEFFEWDDSVAAERWRLDQARTLIREVKISTVVESQTITSVAYVHDERLDEGEAGYVSIVHVMSDLELAHETLAHEFKMAAASIRRARSVAKVLGKVDELDQILAQVVSFPGDIQRAKTDRPQPPASDS